jgi:hypothetical protein
VAQFGKNLYGSKPATMDQINEIVRGATVKSITSKMIDPDEGGECIAIEFNGGDALVFVAVPGPVIRVVGAPTATIQPLLVTKRNTKLKAH